VQVIRLVPEPVSASSQRAACLDICKRSIRSDSSD
jgi:hypothetical protein